MDKIDSFTVKRLIKFLQDGVNDGSIDPEYIVCAWHDTPSGKIAFDITPKGYEKASDEGFIVFGLEQYKP